MKFLANTASLCSLFGASRYHKTSTEHSGCLSLATDWRCNDTSMGARYRRFVTYKH